MSTRVMSSQVTSARSTSQLVQGAWSVSFGDILTLLLCAVLFSIVISPKRLSYQNDLINNVLVAYLPDSATILLPFGTNLAPDSGTKHVVVLRDGFFDIRRESQRPMLQAALGVGSTAFSKLDLVICRGRRLEQETAQQLQELLAAESVKTGPRQVRWSLGQECRPVQGAEIAAVIVAIE